MEPMSTKVKALTRPFVTVATTVTICTMYYQSIHVPSVLEIMWQLIVGWYFTERAGGKIVGGLVKAVKAKDVT